jgi:hypothetical protein
MEWLDNQSLTGTVDCRLNMPGSAQQARKGGVVSHSGRHVGRLYSCLPATLSTHSMAVPCIALITRCRPAGPGSLAVADSCARNKAGMQAYGRVSQHLPASSAQSRRCKLYVLVKPPLH